MGGLGCYRGGEGWGYYDAVKKKNKKKKNVSLESLYEIADVYQFSLSGL